MKGPLEWFSHFFPLPSGDYQQGDGGTAHGNSSTDSSMGAGATVTSPRTEAVRLGDVWGLFRRLGGTESSSGNSKSQTSERDRLANVKSVTVTMKGEEESQVAVLLVLLAEAAIKIGLTVWVVRRMSRSLRGDSGNLSLVSMGGMSVFAGCSRQAGRAKERALVL